MSRAALQQGRDAFARRAWEDAHTHLSAAALEATPGDLDLLARAAYLTGRDSGCERAWAAAHQAFLDGGHVAAAARTAFWLGLVLSLGGKGARASGWMGRAARLVDGLDPGCPERGYLQLADGLGHLHGGRPDVALARFGEAVDIAERVAEPDLHTLGHLGSGQARIALGETAQAVRSLDEAMVAVEAEEVSTVVAGIVYCAVVLACHQVLDLRRAQEWTDALRTWCAAQPDLVAYRGQCLVHVSELAQLRGDWPTAIVEADRACAFLADPPGQPAVGMAHYQRGELHRLRGELHEAEQAYRRASRHGHEPQPGLVLLRLAQGRVGDAVGAVRRLVGLDQAPGLRSKVLAAGAEVMLADGDVPAARAAADELADLASRHDVPVLWAVAGQVTGRVLLSEGEARQAVAALHRSLSAWEELQATYEVARVRVQLAAACRELGDADTAGMEEAAARAVFAEVGARPDLARLEGRDRGARAHGPAGLTGREVEVIRLVAAGRTNREIAHELVISDKTVARHLSNMFTRLGLPNRAAATAYAYEHDLVGGHQYTEPPIGHAGPEDG